jgi:GT2 family glycosyltransferase
MDKFISVIFVTYNRKNLLYEAISAAKKQSLPLHIIVMDDASDDGTNEMIQACFPDLCYYRSEKNYGPSYQRNRGAEKAISDIVCFFDDDTVIKDRYIVEKTLAEFNEDNIGAVAIPFINILQDDKIQTGAPARDGTYVYHAFIAAAFAVRRDLFISLGGFREDYFYMGEEKDFCIRLLEQGYYVKGGSTNPAYHYQPLNRVSFTADFYGRRNDILFIYLNSPKQLMLGNILIKVIAGFLYGIKVGRLRNMVMGILAGINLMFNENIKRLKKPVSYPVFMEFRYLKGHEPVLLQSRKSKLD